jgi:hypothetical protein
MRASSFLISAVFVFAAGCASFSRPERVLVFVWNYSAAAPRLRVLIDGEPLLDETARVTMAEPAIVSTNYLRLRGGVHRIEVTRDRVTQDFSFIVRPRTRTDVHVRLNNGGTFFDVTYGEKLYI